MVRFHICLEVSDELYDAHLEMEKQERRNNKRETRRHISLDYLNDKGVEFEGAEGNPLDTLIAQEDVQEFNKGLSEFLTPAQIELLYKVWNGYTLTEIAKYEGVQIPAISKRLKRILRKFEEFSEKGKDLPSAVGIGRGTKTAYYELRGKSK